jgi:TPR repeat/MerR HTH family regulatory protein
MAQGCENPLFDQRIAITGRFGSHSHAELVALLTESGAHIDRYPTRRTKLLIVGSESLPLVGNARANTALTAAHRLQLTGYPIEVVGEQMLWHRLDAELPDVGVRQLYTLPQLRELLDVKRDQIRYWMRAGLLNPTENACRPPLFDLAQVQLANLVSQLRRNGLPIVRIAWQFARIRKWFPNLNDQFGRLATTCGTSGILIRLEHEELIEASGQRWLDFELGQDPTTFSFVDWRSADDWFDEGLRLEDACLYEDAEEAYRAALRLEPSDPVVHFNLGNVYVALDDFDSAEKHFVFATRLDREYSEAWTNLEYIRSAEGSPDPIAASQSSEPRSRTAIY